MPVVTPDQITTNFIFMKMNPSDELFIGCVLVLMAQNLPVYGMMLVGVN